MITLEVNQQIGKKVGKFLWRKTLARLNRVLKIKKSFKISLALVDGKTIRKFNKIYRGKDKVTDVLSFSETGRAKKLNFLAKNYLGEVIICYPQAVTQARFNKKSLAQELSLLLVHGVLHLLGYDHIKAAKARIMRGLEKKILG